MLFFLYPKTLQRIINCRWTELEMLNIFSDNTCILTNTLISGRKKKKKEHWKHWWWFFWFVFPLFSTRGKKKHQWQTKRNKINERFYFRATLTQTRIFIFSELSQTALFSICFNWKDENEILHFFLINNSKLLVHKRLEGFSFSRSVHKTNISMM